MTLMVTNLIGFGASSSAGNDPFFEIIEGLSLNANMKICLDIGDSSCTDHSSQTFTDRSAASTDFHNGGSTSSASDDATFAGAAGGLSSSDYLTFGGDDFIECKTSPAFIANMHKNSAVFSIIVWIYAIASGTSHYFSNGLNANDHGFRFNDEGASLKLSLTVGKGSAGNPLSKATDSAVMKVNAWNMIGVSITEATGADDGAGLGGGFFYCGNVDGNGYAQVGSADTFDSTYTSPSSSAATNDVNIGADGQHSGNFFPNLTRFAGVFVRESAIWTKANMDSIFDATKGRFDIT
jgi:hypothetical protein